MFPVLLAELRPLFFRYRLRRDKDESVELEFNFLTPHPGFAFRWQHAIHLQALNIQHAHRRLKSGSSPVFASGYVRLTGFGVFLMFCPRPLRKQRAAILNRQPAVDVPIRGSRP